MPSLASTTHRAGKSAGFTGLGDEAWDGDSDCDSNWDGDSECDSDWAVFFPAMTRVQEEKEEKANGIKALVNQLPSVNQ
jgi:hypothetical protein